MKPTNSYIGAILDVCGCFHKTKAGYEKFKITSRLPRNIKLFDAVVKELKHKKIDISKYKSGNLIIYQTSKKDTVERIKKYMKKYSLIRRE